MYRLRLCLLFQSIFRYRGSNPERPKRAARLPPCQRTCQRYARPSRGFIDMNETGEEGVAREVLEETGLKVQQAVYQFSLPNIYIYSGFPVHTLDMFFLCTVEDISHFSAMDDVSDSFFLPLSEINPEDFGLDSIRRGLKKFLSDR